MGQFYWGCATASAQIEGAFSEDNKGLTIWDKFCSTKGKIKDGSTNQVACDSYHKYKEDIALLKRLGCNAYRFSIAWSRIIPDGEGEINEKGLKHYSDIIDECIKNGIEPFITLFHWDMPLKLYEKGSFNYPKFIECFSRYCEVVISSYANRVKNWIIINEPTCIIGGTGGVDPDKEHSIKELLQVVHILNLCSAKGIEIAHKYGCLAGLSYCGPIYAPAHDDSQIEYDEAKRRTMQLEKDDLNIFSIFMDPNIKGEYPKKLFEVYDSNTLPNITDEDKRLIKNNTCDFVGNNVYFVETLSYENGEFVLNKNISSFRTTMNWHVYDKSLYWAAKIMCDVYKKPYYIFENGISVDDADDEIRSEYIKNYVKYLLKAKDEGLDIRGYFYWSLLDNFEWFQGYGPKFGLVHRDRTIKDSFHTYEKIIKQSRNR